MAKDYQAITWCSAVEDDFRSLLDIAIREDVESIGDLTSLSLIPEKAVGHVDIGRLKPGTDVNGVIDPALSGQRQFAGTLFRKELPRPLVFGDSDVETRFHGFFNTLPSRSKWQVRSGTGSPDPA